MAIINPPEKKLTKRTSVQRIIETHYNICTVKSESSGAKLTRFEIEGWLVLIRTPSVNILHQSDCAWPCCLLSQYVLRICGSASTTTKQKLTF